MYKMDLKSTNNNGECDLLTPLNSIYLFSETVASLIDSSEKCNCWSLVI